MLQSDDGTVCGFSGVRDRYWSFSGSYSRTGCSCRSTIQVLGSRCPTDLEILAFAKHFPQRKPVCVGKSSSHSICNWSEASEAASTGTFWQNRLRPS